MDKLTPPQNMMFYEYVWDCWHFAELIFRDEFFVYLLLVFYFLLYYSLPIKSEVHRHNDFINNIAS